MAKVKKGRPSNETVLTPPKVSPSPGMVVAERTYYFTEVDYPEAQGWRSTQKHPTPEAAALQWIERDPPSPYPCRIIRRTETVVESVVGEMLAPEAQEDE